MLRSLKYEGFETCNGYTKEHGFIKLLLASKVAMGWTEEGMDDIMYTYNIQYTRKVQESMVNVEFKDTLDLAS